MKIDNQERIIIDNWFKKNKEIGELIGKNNKQVSYIKSKLRKLFLNNQRSYLTEDKIRIILQNKKKKTASQISEDINISPQKIYRIWHYHNKIKSNNPKDYMFNYHRSPWNLDETIYIEQNYDKPYSEIKKVITDRSKHSINLKKWYIQKNGGTFYNIEKKYNEKCYLDDFILKIGNRHTAKELSILLNSSSETIRGVAKRLNVKLKYVNNPWRDEEINILKEMYPNNTAREISERIGRTYDATKAKIKELGIKKT